MKTLRRTLRPYGKTAQAIWRWKRFSFNDAPPIFGNSKPKSGSHLLLQILNGFTQIMPYKYVDADPVRTIKKDGGRRTADGGRWTVERQVMPRCGKGISSRCKGYQCCGAMHRVRSA